MDITRRIAWFVGHKSRPIPVKADWYRVYPELHGGSDVLVLRPGENDMYRFSQGEEGYLVLPYLGHGESNLGRCFQEPFVTTTYWPPRPPDPTEMHYIEIGDGYLSRHPGAYLPPLWCQKKGRVEFDARYCFSLYGIRNSWVRDSVYIAVTVLFGRGRVPFCTLVQFLNGDQHVIRHRLFYNVASDVHALQMLGFAVVPAPGRRKHARPYKENRLASRS